MNFAQSSPFIYYACLLAACGYAFFRGNRTEYLGAAIILAGSLATTIGLSVFETAWTGFGTSTFYIDMIVLLALIHLTLVSDRFWPMWVTAFHLVAISVHVATAVAPDLAPWALATGSAFWAYPMLLALAIGAHEYVRPAEAERLRSG
ncbi:hypothetical protein MNBD_ALPHA04-1946 [hydrothermal vent metagenome]|uniref:Uncharacterized protein n=1 Tax=hydrothermal vent metagenome TaxID=652676 RepID=A0A3B0RFT7_9ZZZZ